MTTWTKEATDTTISSTATGQITASSLDVDNINIDGNTITVTDTNGDLMLKPNGTGDITMTSSVGSTSVGALHLDGATNNMYWNSGADDFIFSFAAGLLYVDKPNNRVGIQTTSPDAKLHVVGGIFLEDASPEITFETGGTHYNWQIAAQEYTTQALQFAVGSVDADASNDTFTPKMTILSNGDVGIGTTAPDAKLEVVGSFAANGPSSTFVTMSSEDTSPDVSTGNIFKSHSDQVTIDQFDGGVCGQIIIIISGGATEYDVTSSELKGGTTNIRTDAGDVTMWVCESATVWHLLSWMDLSINLSSGGF